MITSSILFTWRRAHLPIIYKGGVFHIPNIIFCHRLSKKHSHKFFTLREEGGKHSFNRKKLMIPPVLLPISKLGASGVPITLPRRATTRWRALKRTMRLCRTGTNTSATLMRRRRGFSSLFSRGGFHRCWREGRTIHVQTRFSKISTLRRLSTILRVQRRGEGKEMFRGHPVPRVRQSPIGIYIHCRGIIPSRKRTVLLPERNRVSFLSVQFADQVSRRH